MRRKIIIKTNKEAQVPVEALYELRQAAFGQWTDEGLDASEVYGPVERFRRYLNDKLVFVAQDAETGELLAMRTLKINKKKECAAESNLSVSPNAKRQGIGTQLFAAETQWLIGAGYKYVTCSTATTATWSVQWHLKNGYYIVGYSRSERNNYASYIFRKQIATDVRHHPTDLLWTRPLAPLTAKLLYCLSWLATNICKSKSGKLNAIGRIAKEVRRIRNATL